MITTQQHCPACESYTTHEVTHVDGTMERLTCRRCGNPSWRSAHARPGPQADRWSSYLARQIGRLQGYGECSIEEHSISLEIAARQALAGPLPAAVEEQLREAMDRVAEAWVARDREREEVSHGSR